MGYLFLGIALWAFIGGLIGAAIGNSKGRRSVGFWLGLFFGGIGWIIVAVMQPTLGAEVARINAIKTIQSSGNSTTGSNELGTRNCPYCAETIKSAAVVCRFCGHDVEPVIEEGPAVRVAHQEKSWYGHVSDKFPKIFDAVWDEAQKYQPWPSDATKMLRGACILANKGLPVQEATRSWFLKFTTS